MIDKELLDILNNTPGIKLSMSGLLIPDDYNKNYKNKIEFKVKNKNKKITNY